MKRCFILILCMALLLSLASAEVVQVNTELEGHETAYRLYDREAYEAPCDHAGTVVKVKYTSNVYDRSYKRYVNVYLPYGYDEAGDERYPIIYFLHGNGCDQTTLIGNPYTVNSFDHMIDNGDIPPVIIVAPTYFYDVRNKLVDEEKFVQEMREEIIPLVEGTYRTFAASTDEADLIASRNQRALCGFSRGGMTAWVIMGQMVDLCRTFLPCAAPSSEEQIMAGLNAVFAGDYADDFFVYMACGGPEDLAYEGNVAFVRKLLGDERIRFGNDIAKDNFYFLASDNPHQDLCTRYYLYNAFLDGLFK